MAKAAGDSLTGTRLGRFRITRLIGKGGMGEVYAALDEHLDREVAIKVLSSAVDQEPHRRRFLREARLAARLNHPNIASIYEVSDSSTASGSSSGTTTTTEKERAGEKNAGRLYIVMELLEGQPLRNLLAERRLTIDETLSIARDIARALARAHAGDVIHRDIKPENVFITSSGPGSVFAKVLDFGLARDELIRKKRKDDEATATDLTGPGEACGTAGYLAPEQARGQSIDVRADVFSFGAVLYEMLAGKRAFDGRNHLQRMLAVVKNKPDAIRERAPDISPELEDLLECCLEKAPADRYADGAALLAAVEEIVKGNAPTTNAASSERHRVVVDPASPPAHVKFVGVDKTEVMLGGPKPARETQPGGSGAEPATAPAPAATEPKPAAAVTLMGGTAEPPVVDNKPSKPPSPTPALAPVKASLKPPPRPERVTKPPAAPFVTPPPPPASMPTLMGGSGLEAVQLSSSNLIVSDDGGSSSSDLAAEASASVSDDSASNNSVGGSATSAPPTEPVEPAAAATKKPKSPVAPIPYPQLSRWLTKDQRRQLKPLVAIGGAGLGVSLLIILIIVIASSGKSSSSSSSSTQTSRADSTKTSAPSAPIAVATNDEAPRTAEIAAPHELTGSSATEVAPSATEPSSSSSVAVVDPPTTKTTTTTTHASPPGQGFTRLPTTRPSASSAPPPVAAAVATPVAAAAAPRETPKVGTVRVTTDVLTIVVDGEHRRVTNGNAVLSCGRHRIRVGMRGEQVVDVPCGGTISL